VQQLRDQSEQLAETTIAINTAMGDTGSQHFLTTKQFEFEVQSEESQSNLAMVESLPVDAGEIVRPIKVRPVHDGWYISFISGVLIGLTLGAVHLRSRDYRPKQTGWRLRLRLGPDRSRAP